MNEKIIEEMAKVIESVKLYGIDNYGRKISHHSALELAEELLKHYQPKPPEGSVVLTKDEWAEYVELRNSEVGELVKENRELGKQCLDWMKLYHKQLTKTDEARKETAKEFAEKMKTINFDIDFTFKQSSFEDVKKVINLMFNYLMDYIDEIAKQFGVEE